MTTSIVCLDEERMVTGNNPIRAHREKGGRPKGSTNEMKTLESNCIIATKNEIVSTYQGVFNAKEVVKRSENGTLEALIKSVKHSVTYQTLSLSHQTPSILESNEEIYLLLAALVDYICLY